MLGFVPMCFGSKNIYWVYDFSQLCVCIHLRVWIYINTSEFYTGVLVPMYKSSHFKDNSIGLFSIFTEATTELIFFHQQHGIWDNELQSLHLYSPLVLLLLLFNLLQGLYNFSFLLLVSKPWPLCVWFFSSLKNNYQCYSWYRCWSSH